MGLHYCHVYCALCLRTLALRAVKCIITLILSFFFIYIFLSLFLLLKYVVKQSVTHSFLFPIITAVLLLSPNFTMCNHLNFVILLSTLRYTSAYLLCLRLLPKFSSIRNVTSCIFSFCLDRVML